MSDKHKKIAELLNNFVPFHRHLGIVVTKLEDGFVRLELPYREEFVGDPRRPALHGGLISTLIDSCGGAAVWSRLEIQDRVSTVDIRIDFLRPAPAQALICEATCLRLGNMVGVCEMRVYNPAQPDTIVATGKAVYNVRKG